MTPTISHLEWLSKDAQEAILTVTDGMLSVRIFSQPCSLQEGDRLLEPVLAFNTSDIVRMTTMIPDAQVIMEPFAQECHGVVEDIGAKLIRVGALGVILDIPIPGDIAVGEAVAFRCARLDCLE